MKLKMTFLMMTFLSVQTSYGMSCDSFLKKESNRPTEQVLIDLEDSVKLVSEVDDNYQNLKKFLAETDEHIKLLALNQKLRDRKGGFARILDAQIIAKVNKLKNALRENDAKRARSVADPVMLSFERDILELNYKQQQLATFKKQIRENDPAVSNLSDRQQKSIAAKIELEIEALINNVHTNYKLYFSFRRFFTDQIANGVSEDAKTFALNVYTHTGISAPDQVTAIPDYLAAGSDGRRPTEQMILDEFKLNDLPNGEPRHLKGQSLEIGLKLENEALKEGILKRIINPRAAHLVIDTFAQLIRKAGDNKYNKFLAGILDVAVKDLQNLSAMTEHLSEIDKINSISISEQVSSFEKVRANFMNSGLMRSHSFDFLTSFARAHEYKRLWERISLELVLRNVDATNLVDALISKEKEVDRVNAQLDLVRADINSKETNIALPDDLATSNTALMSQKATLEAELSSIRAEIDSKITEFEKNKSSSAALMARPGMREDVALLDQMTKAEERSAVLGPLSYDYSPGTGVRFTRLTIIYLAAARYAIVNTSAITTIDAILLKHFGFTIPEWEQIWNSSQFIFYKAAETLQSGAETMIPPL